MGSKEVLFVHPSSPMLERQRMVPPMGSLQLAAVAREGGHKVDFLDVGNEPPDIEQLLDTQYLLFTTTTPQHPGAVEIAKRVWQERSRRGLKWPILAVGGTHASVLGAKLLEEGCWDHVCRGEGEEIIIPLVEGELTNELIVGRRVEKLDELPYPAYDLLDLDIYRRSDEHDPTLPIITSRGCPFHCVFCFTVFGKDVRNHSVDYVVGVERRIVELGVNQIVKYDDTFTLHPQRVVEICQGIKPLGVTWRCNGQPKTMTTANAKEVNMLEEMRDAGCVHVSIGVDGANQEALDYLKKGTTIAQCEEAITATKEAGMLAKIYLIYIPGWGENYVESAEAFINRTEPDVVQVSVLMPMPGSAIYERPGDYGLTFDRSALEGYYYCGLDGQSGDVGLLDEGDNQALDRFGQFLNRWREGKQDIPI